MQRPGTQTWHNFFAALAFLNSCLGVCQCRPLWPSLCLVLYISGLEQSFRNAALLLLACPTLPHLNLLPNHRNYKINTKTSTLPTDLRKLLIFTMPPPPRPLQLTEGQQHLLEEKVTIHLPNALFTICHHQSTNYSSSLCLRSQV